ncbi:restriction endonuclease subunit S [methanotrophic endosymbiont of Bathymodiolus puteoserpentis (Logatchev)]|jgi:type I restriction enzyme S subunit|uniref:restriction endonuclease subunit S n=1 Tax=methanotrophic endosymbiont of Bathymodiolus puteoserpentis (Logatchev) TaxID=343235 RepID=UPI0013CABABC|nr:restriction endonuclease subunit S [methanotrophic endosymbiont of Bathymodiolus puteoserpentis (Logatchev)]SHE23763.1 Type I restriction-modification system, specificity subunit S [methanotrophic endosymbiont of Bathymodiolus puteoserpentis (Logatchev)]
METQHINLKNLDKSNWQTYRFDQIEKSISERIDPNNTELEVYIGLEHINAESLHIKRFGSRDDVNGQKLRCYPGDVIFGRRRAYQRKAAIATVDGFCSAHSLVLRAIPEVIDPKLFPFFLHSDLFMHRAVDISVGSLSPTINWGTLKHQEFKLPPKEQQAKLAELLWAMDEVVEKESIVLEKIRRAKRCYEKQFLYKYKVGIEKNLPAGYTVKRLMDIADISGGSTPSRGKAEYWGGEIPWLTPTDVTRHNKICISETKEYITVNGLKNISNRLYPPGSILFCSRATIGVAVINEKTMATNQGFSNFICNKLVRNYFLYFLLQHLTPELTRLAGGSTFLEISKSAIRIFKIVLPDSESMEKIEKELWEFTETIKSIEDKVVNSKFLQKSLINQIF